MPGKLIVNLKFRLASVWAGSVAIGKDLSQCALILIEQFINMRWLAIFRAGYFRSLFDWRREY
jgi:hypothetical protein